LLTVTAGARQMMGSEEGGSGDDNQKNQATAG
jgi:hypothetical protein